MKYCSVLSLLTMSVIFAGPSLAHIAALPVVSGQATYYDSAGSHTYDLSAQELASLTDGNPATGVHLEAWPYWVNSSYQVLPPEVRLSFDASELVLNGLLVNDLLITASAHCLVTVPSIAEDYPAWHYARVEAYRVDISYDEGIFSWNTAESGSASYTWSRLSQGLIPLHVGQSGLLTLTLGAGATISNSENPNIGFWSVDAYELSIGEVVPEPSSVLALLFGLGGAAGWMRRRSRG